MKKILIVFLVIDIILLFCYCNIRNNSDDSPTGSESESTTSAVVTSTAATTKQPIVTTPKTTVAQGTTADTTPEEKPSSGCFASYESILELCRTAVESLDYVNQNPNGLADQLFGLEESIEKEWFLALDSSLTVFYPGRGKEDRNSPHYKLSLGYDYKDLNGDGIDELVLLTDEFIVIAIFSMAEGKPVLLANYRERHRAWIDENGWIHHNGSSGAAYSNNIVYKVASGGASLEVIAGFGTNGAEWVGEEAVTIYYKLVNGEKVRIPKDEHDSLEKYFGEYLDWDATKQATKEKAELVFQPLFVDAAMAAFEKVLALKKPVYDTGKNNYVFLDKVQFLNEVNDFYYTVMDFDGDSVNEFLIGSSKIFLLRYYQGEVYLYSFEQREMATLFTDGTACGHIGVDSKHARGYRISFEGTELKKQVVADAYTDLETQEYRFTIEGKEVTSEEWDRYFDEKALVRFSIMLNRSETCLTQDVQDTWEDDLVTLLSGLEPYDPEAVSISTYAVGLFDLNFDNTPEVLVIYPGGSMGNMWVKIYDLKQPDEPICDYNGMSIGENYLTVAKTGDDYVVLTEGSIRGRSYRLELLTFDSGVVETKELFGVGDSSNDPNQYFYMGEPVEKAKYDEEYQKFLNDYTVLAETEISLVFWKDYDLSNQKQLVRDIAEDLVYSSQTFIDYKNN